MKRDWFTVLLAIYTLPFLCIFAFRLFVYLFELLGELICLI